MKKPGEMWRYGCRICGCRSDGCHGFIYVKVRKRQVILMNIKKNSKALLFFIVIFLLCGCSHNDGMKTVKTSKFTDLIFDKNLSIPSTDFTWNMTTDEFLSKVYRADIFDSDSKNFEQYRYSYSEETHISTYSPFITYKINSFPKEADIAFVFDESGLFRADYGWVFEDTEVENIETTLRLLIDDLNSNPNVAANEFDLSDFSNKNTLTFPYQYQWNFVNEPDKYIKADIGKIKNFICIAVSVRIAGEGVAH